MTHFLVGSVLFPPTQVVLDGAGEQHVFLQYHGNFFSQRFDIVFSDISAADFYSAFCGVIQTGNQLYQCTLGTAGAADNTYCGTGRNFQIYIIQTQFVGVFAIYKVDMVKFDAAVFDFINRVFRIMQVAFFI